MRLMTTCIPHPSVGRFAAAALLATLLAGCAGGALVRGELLVPERLIEADSILVVPFENLTGLPEAGTAIADLAADELRGWQGYAIRDRHTLAEMSERGELALPSRWSRAEALPLADRTASRLVLVGTVHEYGYVREGDDLSEIASLAVSLRLIDFESGRAVWSGVAHAKQGSDREPGSLSLSKLARGSLRAVIRDMFLQLQAWQDRRLATAGG